MSTDNHYFPNGVEPEPMREEIFKIAASAVSFHGASKETPKIVQAAKCVLVDGMRPGEAAAKYDFPPERVSEAVGRIRDKWNAICAEQGWITETFSLSPSIIRLIQQIENEAIEPLQKELEAKRKKKIVQALKVAEKKPRKYQAKSPKK